MLPFEGFFFFFFKFKLWFKNLFVVVCWVYNIWENVCDSHNYKLEINKLPNTLYICAFGGEDEKSKFIGVWLTFSIF